MAPVREPIRDFAYHPNMDFKGQLSKQLRYIETSCREYDAGNHDEAIRMATALRVIFHSTKSSTSLLSHLLAVAVPMLSTAHMYSGMNPRSLWPGPFAIHIDPVRLEVVCTPRLGENPVTHRTVPFSEWWESEVIFHSQGRKVRRRQVVLDAAHKDGGAHVDTEFTPDYEFLIDGKHIILEHNTQTGEHTVARLLNIQLPCLRQIAYETLNSPDLLKLAE